MSPLPEQSARKQDSARIRLMIAPGKREAWAADLARILAAWPVDLLWSRTDNQAVDLAASRQVQVALVDATLPLAGGLEAIRRIRRLGIDLPSLLVCDEPTERLLHQALALDVFTVIQMDSQRSVLAPTLCKLVKQVYHVEWPYGYQSN
ncbi:MAG TPA: response regulator [Phycisphaerae bacterium]|nr:response regulator [Phycisphaerae bacterium]